MIRESRPSPALDAGSAAVDASGPPPGLPEAVPARCPGCDAPLHSSARFCSQCGAAQVLPAEDEAQAICSQFGASSADLAELLSAGGHVVPCPRCDELNNAAAAYCRHCGEQLPAAEASHPYASAEEPPGTSERHDDPRQARVLPAIRRAAPRARRYGLAIAPAVALGIAAVALWLTRSPTVPASSAAPGEAPRSAAAAQPAESVVATAPEEPALPSPAAPSPAPQASDEARERAPSSVSPPKPEPRAMPAREGVRKKTARTAALRAFTPAPIDALYRQRAAGRCAEGLSGLICREELRFELCNGKWTQDAPSGMEICRLNR